MKARIGLLVFGVVLSFLGGLLVGDIGNEGGITGFAVQDDLQSNYTWTKAICDDQNRCVDVVIDCRNGDIVRAQLASSLINFSNDWEDPRGEFAEEYC